MGDWCYGQRGKSGRYPSFRGGGSKTPLVILTSSSGGTKTLKPPKIRYEDSSGESIAPSETSDEPGLVDSFGDELESDGDLVDLDDADRHDCADSLDVVWQSVWRLDQLVPGTIPVCRLKRPLCFRPLMF